MPHIVEISAQKRPDGLNCQSRGSISMIFPLKGHMIFGLVIPDGTFAAFWAWLRPKSARLTSWNNSWSNTPALELNSKHISFFSFFFTDLNLKVANVTPPLSGCETSYSGSDQRNATISEGVTRWGGRLRQSELRHTPVQPIAPSFPPRLVKHAVLGRLTCNTWALTRSRFLSLCCAICCANFLLLSGRKREKNFAQMELFFFFLQRTNFSKRALAAALMPAGRGGACPSPKHTLISYICLPTPDIVSLQWHSCKINSSL